MWVQVLFPAKDLHIKFKGDNRHQQNNCRHDLNFFVQLIFPLFGKSDTPQEDGNHEKHC